MDWKRRHWAVTLLLASPALFMNLGEPIGVLVGSVLGGVLTGAIIVFVVSAPTQWAVSKYRARGDGGTASSDAAD